jgi:hypothetical protein
VEGIAELITAALQAGPWAVVGVAAVLVVLVVAGACAYCMRERARARTIVDTAGAITPSGGVVIQKRGRQSLTVVLPVPPPDSLGTVRARSQARISPIIGASSPLDAPHQEIER